MAWLFDENGNLVHGGYSVSFSELVTYNGTNVVDIDGNPLTALAYDAERLGGILSNEYALKTDTVDNASKLGNVGADEYALKSDTVSNADSLGGTAADEYALKTGTIENANKLGNKAADDYALKSGTISNASNLGGTAADEYALKSDTVSNADSLGGTAADDYALKSGTIENANKLGNKAADDYALKTGTIENANKLGGVDASEYTRNTDLSGTVRRIIPSDSRTSGTNMVGNSESYYALNYSIADIDQTKYDYFIYGFIDVTLITGDADISNLTITAGLYPFTITENNEDNLSEISHETIMAYTPADNDSFQIKRAFTTGILPNDNNIVGASLFGSYRLINHTGSKDGMIIHDTYNTQIYLVEVYK